MPFLDSRVVNFFVSLPNSARRLHHEPKHVIQAQFEKPNMIRFADGERSRREHKEVAAASSEELLLHGTLGEYLREILATPTFAHQVPGIFEFIDENYLSSQLDAFIRSAPGINYKFMSRLGALEMWCRMASADSHSALFARATA